MSSPSQATRGVQAVIWDLDGVIIDSAEEHRKAWQQLAREEGVTFTDEQFWATFGQRNDSIIPTIWGSITDEKVKALADRKEAYFRKYVRETATPLPGAIELLSALHDSGYPQALGSSTPIANIDLIKNVLGLQRYISVFVSGEAVPHGKPAPDLFLQAAHELGVEPVHCLVIEDAVAGIAAARAGGMYTIAVAGARHLPELQLANIVVHDLTQVTLARIEALV